MAEKIYKIQRELEEKRLKRLQEQSCKNSSSKGAWQQSAVIPGTYNNPVQFGCFQNRFQQPSKSCLFLIMWFFCRQVVLTDFVGVVFVYFCSST